MLQVVTGNTMNRTTLMVSEDSTLSSVIDQATQSGIVFDQNESFTLNGIALKRSRGDLDRTFGEYGATGRVTLVSVKNSQNAC